MRPLIVDLGRDYRGGQDQALLLLRGLRARGHAPELITLSDSLLARRAIDADIPTHGVASRWRRLGAAFAIRRLIRAHRADVIHANEPHALSSAWLARARRSVPLVASRRVELPLSTHPMAMARYRATRRVVAVSDFVRESVIASGLPSELAEVIYVGVEVHPGVSRADRDTARRRFSIPPESLCIGNVAALVPEKGHVLLLRALSQLRSQFPNTILLIAGEGRERDNLQALVRQLQLEGMVKFAGFVPDVERVYAATDLFVFPSHQEPLACAMLSAMAFGLPVVAFARGGNPEALDDGRNGLLVKKLDFRALADALAQLLSNPEEARRLGEAARATVIARFSADHMVEETLRLYEHLLTSR